MLSIALNIDYIVIICHAVTLHRLHLDLLKNFVVITEDNFIVHSTTLLALVQFAIEVVESDDD